MRIKRKLLILATAATLITATIYCYFPLATKGKLYDDVTSIPHREIAVVLGTTPGSDHYQARMDAAAELYLAGKTNKLLLSGGTKNQNSDETLAMKQELIKRGIPAHALLTDPYGYRTLDSMIRAKEVFGITECIIVSQPFHNARAIILSNAHDLDARGYNAREAIVSEQIYAKIREVLARIRATIDLTTGTAPDTLKPPPDGNMWQEPPPMMQET